MPGGQETAERGLLRRFDLTAKRRQRRPPDAPQDVRVAPLALRAPGPELPANQALAGLESLQLLLDTLRFETEARGRLGGRERPVRLRKAHEQRRKRFRDRLEERIGEPAGRDDTERVAVEPCVLGCDERALGASEPHPDRPSFPKKRLREAAVRFRREQMPGPPQEVMELVRVPRRRPQRLLHLLDRPAVEEVAQLLRPHELAQQLAIERECLRAALRGGRVVLVHVRRDVVEEERRRERRRRRRLDLDEVELAGLDAAQDAAERGEVEDVLEALAIRLQDDRELRITARDLEQVLRLQPLLPERSPLPGAAARDQERTRRVLAEARAEERGTCELAEHQVFELVRVDQQVGDRRRDIRVREVERDAVVRPERLRVDTERIAQPRRERHRPRCVHAASERRQHADSPVADLVPEALDHDRAVGRHDPGRTFLVAQERDQVGGRAPLEVVVRLEPFPGTLVRERDQLSSRAPDALAELGRPADALPLPERRDAGHARGRGHEHTVARDRLDAPRRRPEQERLPLARLVDHLLVELADTAAAVHQMDAEEPAVGNRPSVRHGEPARAGPPADHPARAIPDDARPELGELVGGITAREHVEHVLERRARELGEGVRAAHQRVEIVDRDFLVGADRDDLLREDVERVARDLGLLDLTGPHGLRDDGALEQVGAELREDTALGDRPERVPRATDALEASCHGLGALDLDDEIDGAHVDPELERRGGDEARDPARLEKLLDLHSLLTRERAVMGARELLLRKLVQPQREPLGEPAVVDEDDRRAVLAHELEDGGVDRRPDRT